MIVDAVLFNSESDMLEFRLRMLWDKVDVFIIVEASHTFSGKPKGWNFSWDRFGWARKKIVYHQYIPSEVWDGSNPPVTTDPLHPCWDMEYAQRNAIADACAGMADKDILLMGDCDEMPSHDVFDKVHNLTRWGAVALRQRFFYYNLSCLRREEWNGTIVTTVGEARRQGVQRLREKRNMLPVFMDGGWHLSYFMDVDGVRNKLNSFSHVEYNTPEYNSSDHISRCMVEGRDLFVRGMQADRVGREFFPEYFLTQSDKFNWWGEK